MYQPTIEKLHELRLFGMAKALQEQAEMLRCDALPFEDRLALIVDREATERENSRLQGRLKKAKLRLAATIEDIDYRHPRGLDKALFLSMASCQWIRAHQNCIVIGPTGVGKSYLACALAHKACRKGYNTLYVRTPRLFEEFTVAKAGDFRSRLRGRRTLPQTPRRLRPNRPARPRRLGTGHADRRATPRSS